MVKACSSRHPWAVRVADLGISIGLLPPGPTSSVLDVPGVGLGHTTVWRDDPDPPGGDGTARTGVSVLDLGGSGFQAPIPAGGAVLNGNGECTGLIMIRECGVLETPIFLTSTMQVGRVYDAAVQLLMAEEPAIGVDDVVIPVVAECDDSFLSDPRRIRVTVDDVAAALAAARASNSDQTPAEEGAVGAGTGMSALGHKGGIGTASRRLPDGHIVAAVTLTNYGERRRLTVDGLAVGRLLADPATGEQRPKPAGSCIVVIVTDGPLDAAGCGRLAARAGLGLARTGSTGHHGSGEIFLAAATGLRAPRGEPPPGVPVRGSGLDPYFAAAVEATEEAALNSLLAARTVTGRDGHTSYALAGDEVRRLLQARDRGQPADD